MPVLTSLFDPLTLPCGVALKNRLAKSAMSDSLGDGTGHPSKEQYRLYQRWAEGGLALSIIGEVQGSPHFAEKPGNLVLNESADLDRFRELARIGGANNAQLWLQLGHAGALAYAPTSDPKGPSALNLLGLRCAEMSIEEVRRVAVQFANTAQLAKQIGFGGVEVHAAHGFLLSQFLSPLFNKREDDYGGSIENRMRLVIETVSAIRGAVGPDFPIAIKLNSSDQLEGGLGQNDALKVVSALDASSVDLIDISGGTYFPGAKSASDSSGSGPYFFEFAKQAHNLTTKPLMLTGGFKTRAHADEAINSGLIDMVGLARAMVLEPELPNLWNADQMPKLNFPRFSQAPEGGITAWYTMRLTQIGSDQDSEDFGELDRAVNDYTARDDSRAQIWLKHFSADTLRSTDNSTRN